MIVLGNGSKATDRPTDYIVHGCAQGIIARHLHHQNSTDEWTERVGVTRGLFLGTSLLTFSLGLVYGTRIVILSWIWFLGALAKLRKATIKFVTSVRLFAYNNSAPTGWMFFKFVI